jgi:hypothetical protein
MKKIIALSLLYMTAHLISEAHAANFQFHNIRVGGVGCPSELTQIVYAPDQSSASLIFNQFESRVPQIVTSPKVNPNIHTLNCNIFIDIKVNQGVKLEAIEIAYDVRGLATLDKGVTGSFRSFLVDKAGMGVVASRTPELLQEKIWNQTNSTQDEDFVIQSSKKVSLGSLCSQGNGANIVSIRLQNTLSAQILQGSSAQGMIVMDSSDMRGGLILKATESSCGQTQPGNGNGNGNGGRNCRIVIVNGRSQQVCR